MFLTNQKISRRTVLQNITIFALAGGSIAEFATACTTSPIPALKPTPAPIIVGSLLYTYRGHTDYVFTVAWSPDGKRIASGGNDNTVQVWDAVDGSHAYTYNGHSFSVSSVVWSLDSTRIASGSHDQTVQLWNEADGSGVYTYHGHLDSVFSIAWSPDGKYIASAGKDETVQVWNAHSGALTYMYGKLPKTQA